MYYIKIYFLTRLSLLSDVPELNNAGLSLCAVCHVPSLASDTHNSYMAGGRWQMADGIWLKMTTRVPVHANVLKSLQNANALDLAPVAQVRA